MHCKIEEGREETSDGQKEAPWQEKTQIVQGVELLQVEMKN